MTSAMCLTPPSTLCPYPLPCYPILAAATRNFLRPTNRYTMRVDGRLCKLARVADDARHLRSEVRRPLAPFQPLAALHTQEPGHANTAAHVLA